MREVKKGFLCEFPVVSNRSRPAATRATATDRLRLQLGKAVGRKLRFLRDYCNGVPTSLETEPLFVSFFCALRSFVTHKCRLKSEEHGIREEWWRG